MLSYVRCISKHELTKSALLNLLHRQCKDVKKFNHYLDQYFSHGRGDFGQDFETTKVMFEAVKKLNKCIITGANSLSGLKIWVSKLPTPSSRQRDTYCKKETNTSEYRFCWWKSLQGV